MKFSTKITIEDFEQKISYRDNIISLGSCFSDEIGSRLESLRFNICVNPFGVLYNPASVASALGRLSSGKRFDEEDVIMDGDLWKSLYHSSQYADYTEKELLETINTSLQKSSQHFISSGWVMITLGTRWVYRLKSKNVIVSNCHKLSGKEFAREQLSIGETVGLLSPFIEAYPDKKWLFTVSPVRHWKDGAHENQLSKATLLLAIEELRKNHVNALYFPAYEVFMDELRDYRFYSEDMLHPSVQAADYVWELFREHLVDGRERELMDMIGKLNEMKKHRPFFPKSDSFKNFKTEMSHLEGVVAQLLNEKKM
ncbi:MAG: GSCFA domain-containing protein [Rikenellaceae bacterium]|nr:GSCFA domain-containing protein [Rikenellaceae bacterium]